MLKGISKKTNQKITILKMLVNKIQPEIIQSKNLFSLKISDCIISGCILFTNFFRMVMFWLVFLLILFKVEQNGLT